MHVGSRKTEVSWAYIGLLRSPSIQHLPRGGRKATHPFQSQRSLLEEEPPLSSSSGLPRNILQMDFCPGIAGFAPLHYQPSHRSSTLCHPPALQREQSHLKSDHKSLSQSRQESQIVGHATRLSANRSWDAPMAGL